MDLNQIHSQDARTTAHQLYEQATNSDVPESIHLERLTSLLKQNPGLLVDTYIDLAMQAASINVGIAVEFSQITTKYPIIETSNVHNWYLIVMGLWGFDVLDIVVDLPQDLIPFSTFKKVISDLVQLISNTIEADGTPVVIVKRAIQSLTFLYPIVFKYASDDEALKWKKEWQDIFNISNRFRNMFSILLQEKLLFTRLCKFFCSEATLFISAIPPKDSTPQNSEIIGINKIMPNHTYLNPSRLTEYGKDGVKRVFDILNVSLQTNLVHEINSLMGFSSTLLLLIESRPALCDWILPKFIEWVTLLDLNNKKHQVDFLFTLKCFNKNLGLMLFQLFRLPRMQCCVKVIEMALKQVKSVEFQSWLSRQERIKQRERHKEAERLNARSAEKLKPESLSLEFKSKDELLSLDSKITKGDNVYQKHKNSETFKSLEKKNINTGSDYLHSTSNNIDDGRFKRKRSFENLSNKSIIANFETPKAADMNDIKPPPFSRSAMPNNYLNKTIDLLLEYNKEQVINLVLNGLASITHQQIQQSKFYPNNFDSILIPELLQLSNKPKTGKSRWSQEEPALVALKNENFILENISGGINAFTENKLDQMTGQSVSYNKDQKEPSKKAADLDFDMDEEYLNMKLEEGANRVQYIVDIAEEMEDIPVAYLNGVNTGIDKKDDSTIKEEKSDLSTRDNIINTGLIQDQVINDQHLDVKSKGDTVSEYVENVNASTDNSSLPQLKSHKISSKFDLWSESISRLLLSGQTLCEQALDKFKYTGGANNLAALLRLHIPNFASQWPLSLQANLEDRREEIITNRERISDWMVLVARVIATSIIPCEGDETQKKIDFIYNEILLSILKAPRQSYELYLMILHELYHQSYIYNRKTSDDDQNVYLMLNNVYSEWSVLITNSIIKTISYSIKTDDNISPLSSQQCEITRKRLLATISDKNLNHSEIEKKLNPVKDPSIRYDSNLESLVNSVPISYESALVNKSLIHYNNDLLVKFVSIKSSNVILGKIKDNLLGRYVLDIPIVNPELIKILHEGLRSCKSDSIFCLSALFDLYKNKPRYEKKVITLLLTSANIPDRTTRVNIIIMVKRMYSKYKNLIDDYIITNFKSLEMPKATSLTKEDVDVNIDQTQKIEHETEDQEEFTMKIEFYIAIMSLNFNLITAYFEKYSQVDSRYQLLMRRAITPLIRQISVGDESEILYIKEYKQLETLVDELLDNCPIGSESLLLRMIILVLEKEKRVNERFVINVNKMIEFINQRGLDGRYLIPILSRMEKKSIVENLCKLVIMLDGSEEMNNLFKIAIRKAISVMEALREKNSKEEIIFEFHYMDPSTCGGLKNFVGSLQTLLSLNIFDPTILGSSLKKIINSERQLPIVLMRSMMLVNKLHPVMKSYLATLLGMLVSNSLPGSKSETEALYTQAIWDNDKIWNGFILCFNLLKPNSYNALDKIPDSKKELIFEKYPEIKIYYERLKNTDVNVSQVSNEMNNQNTEQGISG
ncbi:hypothetical protein BB561_005667 [Smittium simulii]|uniref:Symplekin/Pta1 N-terminal domain-containing protein n=1 Tax=Smittium simulii TaxID=133385 RepID=A0A2T9Y959_9FUNG|nr:hypothetical protein BB561_005667 [Smittium simulii]